MKTYTLSYYDSLLKEMIEVKYRNTSYYALFFSLINEIEKFMKENGHAANISMLFQSCLLVDATSRRGTTSNQR